MWDGYFRLGSLEIANNARALAYAKTAEDRVNWLRGQDCPSLSGALGDIPYLAERIDLAPWYDPRDEATSRFYGIYVLSATLISATRQVTVREGIGPGGVAGRSRRAGKEVRIRAWMTARGLDALDTGFAWLDFALGGRWCSDDGEVPELTFFSDCPPAQESGEDPEDYAARVAQATLQLREVTCISGPIPIETRQSSDRLHWGRLVEFTLYAGVPWIFDSPRRLDIPPSLPTVIQDIPYNLIPYPSAELAGDPVVVSTNYSTNPSVETDATGWNVAWGSEIPAGFRSSGRTTELAADGGASFRARALGDGGATPGSFGSDITIYQDVDITAASPDARFSVTIWGAILILSGVPGVTDVVGMSAQLEWLDSGSSVLDTVAIGAADSSEFDGHVFELESVELPAGAETARVSVIYEFTMTSSATPSQNSDVRVYADVLGVTVP
jgi:hypothetical protein